MNNEQTSFFDDEIENVKVQIEKLKEQINYYSKMYHENNVSEITDYAYDKLTSKLRKLEDKYPQLKSDDSPTNKIGGKTNKAFAQVSHDVQMQSLQDVFSFKEIEEFIDKAKKEFGDKVEFLVETKIDGLSVSLEYEKGILVRGSTRGDGYIGEDVTQNIMMIADVPQKLKSDDTVELRGEVYLPRAEFEKINESLLSQGKTQLANPRNAAAGTLRQLDTKLVKNRNLSIFVFGVLKGNLGFDKDIDNLEYLQKQGVKILEYIEKCSTKEEVINAVKKIGELRDDLAYDIDGAVVKINNLHQRLEMGKTIKVPKWAVAYKYPPEQKETKILDIVVQVGRTGQVTPMAILEPIRIAGSLISKTTLHNFDYIDLKDIRIGDIVVIEKAGDVIPEVVEVRKDKRTGSEKKYIIPTVCPICGEDLEKEENTVALRCTNSECPAQIYRSLVHFASRDCMDISGLGENIIDTLIDNNLIFDVADIYYLKYEDIINLERFAKKSADNLIEAINKSKDNSLDKVIFGLGIRHIGKKAAKILSQNYDDIYEIAKAKSSELEKLNDFGIIMADSVEEFFKKPQTMAIIEKLDNAGVNLKGNKKYLKSNKFNGKIFAITGAFDNYTREDLVKMIEENGGKFSSSVSKKTTYLIAGENSGSKLTKANELKIKNLTISEFLNLVNGE